MQDTVLDAEHMQNAQIQEYTIYTGYHKNTEETHHILPRRIQGDLSEKENPGRSLERQKMAEEGIPSGGKCVRGAETPATSDSEGRVPLHAWNGIGGWVPRRVLSSRT